MNKYKLSCIDPEEEEDNSGQESVSPVIQTTDTDYLYFFDTDVVGIPQYRNLISFLRTAGEEDTIDIVVSSVGGQLFTATTIATEMENSLARIRVSVRGVCASAATVVILSADEVDIDPHASVMFHSASDTPGTSKFHESAQYHTHWHSLFPQIVDYYYKDILTQEEISQLLGGKDFWLTGAELIYRVTQRKNKREKEFLEEQKYELTPEEISSLCGKAKADKRKKIDRDLKTTK